VQERAVALIAPGWEGRWLVLAAMPVTTTTKMAPEQEGPVASVRQVAALARQVAALALRTRAIEQPPP
jgi:hypothetical protein